jgi:hypothetical protein
VVFSKIVPLKPETAHQHGGVVTSLEAASLVGESEEVEFDVDTMKDGERLVNKQAIEQASEDRCLEKTRTWITR